jgi:hypothetical protein
VLKARKPSGGEPNWSLQLKRDDHPAHRSAEGVGGRDTKGPHQLFSFAVPGACSDTRLASPSDLKRWTSFDLRVARADIRPLASVGG